MNKKADTTMLEFLVRLLLAIIIFVPVIAFAANYFLYSNNYSASLDAIFSKIDELNKDSSKEMINLYVRFDGSNGALFAFDKDSSEIVANRYFSDESGDKTGLNSLDTVKVLRPSACDKGYSCICSCSKDFKDENGDTRTDSYGVGVRVFSCGGKLRCKDLDTHLVVDDELVASFKGGMLFGPYAPEKMFTFESFKFSGGFFWTFEKGAKTFFVRKSGNIVCVNPAWNFSCGVAADSPGDQFFVDA